MPARVWRKHRKGRNVGVETRGCSLEFGTMGLQARGYCLLTEKQIRAAWIAAMRPVKGVCSMWKRVFPDVVVTRKLKDARMGSGKGAPEFTVFRIKPGRVILEMSGISEKHARHALSLAAAKLPVSTGFIAKQNRL